MNAHAASRITRGGKDIRPAFNYPPYDADPGYSDAATTAQISESMRNLQEAGFAQICDSLSTIEAILARIDRRWQRQARATRKRSRA